MLSYVIQSCPKIIYLVDKDTYIMSLLLYFCAFLENWIPNSYFISIEK